MDNTRIIAVTGGIGTGKSVVSRILHCLGYPVYDTDSHAKLIMDGSDEIKAAIATEITPAGVNPDGTLNRREIAATVFSDTAKLSRLNSMVHGAVIADMLREQAATTSPIMFVETAIPYQSGIDRIAEQIWEVTAPNELRVERVMARNNATREEVECRIRAQQFTPSQLHPYTHVIINDNISPLLPQILNLIGI